MGDTARTTVTICGEPLEIAATNLACVVYADETLGKLDAPYTGRLIHDLLAERDAVLADGSSRFPEWGQLPRLLDAVWAMARAARSTTDSRKAFTKRVMDGAANLYEAAQVANVIFGDFGEHTFFRLPAGLEALAESDAGQPGDE